MRALRWQKQEPGLAEERRNLVHRYMGDGTSTSPAAAEEPPFAEEEVPVGEAVEEEVSLRLAAVPDVVVNDVETPPDSSSAPRAGVMGETQVPPTAADGLPVPVDEAVEEVSLPLIAAAVDTSHIAVPEPPAPPAATDLLETLQREVDTPRAVAAQSPPPATAPDLRETLRPSAFDAALQTLEEVGRLCEQLVRLGEEHGRWNALLAEKDRQLVPPPGSHGP